MDYKPWINISFQLSKEDRLQVKPTTVLYSLQDIMHGLILYRLRQRGCFGIADVKIQKRKRL